MRPLDDAQRKQVFTWSVLLCAVPLCLAPLAGRSSFELASEQAAFNARFSKAQPQNVWTDKPVAVARDPFVPQSIAAEPREKDSAATNSVVGMQVRQGDSIGYALPPNHGAEAALENGNSGALSVTAVVSGLSPRALIDDGQRVLVVGVGDAVGGSRVLAIDRFGVRLQNGTLLSLTEDHL